MSDDMRELNGYTVMEIGPKQLRAHFEHELRGHKREGARHPSQSDYERARANTQHWLYDQVGPKMGYPLMQKYLKPDAEEQMAETASVVDGNVTFIIGGVRALIEGGRLTSDTIRAWAQMHAGDAAMLDDVEWLATFARCLADALLNVRAVSASEEPQP